MSAIFFPPINCLLRNKRNPSPTLLGGGNLLFSTWILLAEQEAVGATGLLGSTAVTPNMDLPRSEVRDWALARAAGLEVLSLLVAAGWADEATLELLPLSRWRWMAGGSCFIGLS